MRRSASRSGSCGINYAGRALQNENGPRGIVAVGTARQAKQMDDTTELVLTKFKHTIDLLRAENAKLKTEKDHERTLYELRLQKLEDDQKDHETRIRTMQDGVTSFKVWSGLANGGAGLVSLMALFRTISGG